MLVCRTNKKLSRLSIKKKILRIPLLLFWSYYFFFGCSSSTEHFETSTYLNYPVIDKGRENVIVKSKSCSIFPKKALSEAKRSAEYQLRSVIGSQSHRKKFKEINRYKDGKKICVEIMAKGLPPL